ncbi:hypothetical protein BJV74DRAFT_950974 [Russula compacta]|nr:hypothetical protein BJV74DRAFT_950974 [Russula compacta]
MSFHNHSQRPVRRVVSLLSCGITQCLYRSLPDSPFLSDSHFEGDHSVPLQEELGEERDQCNRVSINVLPDDALWEIFHFYRGKHTSLQRWWWKTLVHVCQRWRQIIFASPQGLNLQIICNCRTPTRTSLDTWPPFPIAITCSPWDGDVMDEEPQDNIVAALEHRDRIISIFIQDQKSRSLKKITIMMQEPFPALTDFHLKSNDIHLPPLDLSEAFLGGSAPQLRSFTLWGVAFPAFPKLASSANHLSYLRLWDIPMIGYISPEAVGTCLALLPSLKSLYIGFQSSRSHPDQIDLPPQTRAILPVLTRFGCQANSGYIEDLVARIDAPLLTQLEIKFFVNFEFAFNIPQLHKLIARAERLGLLNRAEVKFRYSMVVIVLGLESPTRVELEIRCSGPSRQVFSMARVCEQLSSLICHVEHLDVNKHATQTGWGSVHPVQWIELLEPFISVQSLSVFGELSPLVAHALQELSARRTTEVLPALRRLFLEQPSPSVSMWEDIELFIARRQHSNHPIDVHYVLYESSD